MAFQESLEGAVLAVYSDNVTAVAYLRKQGGTYSLRLYEEAQQFHRWAEDWEVLLRPQFILGALTVVADALFRSNQMLRRNGPYTRIWFVVY